MSHTKLFLSSAEEISKCSSSSKSLIEKLIKRLKAFSEFGGTILTLNILTKIKDFVPEFSYEAEKDLKDVSPQNYLSYFDKDLEPLFQLKSVALRQLAVAQKAYNIAKTRVERLKEKKS